MRALLASLLLLGACATEPTVPPPATGPATSYLADTKWRRIDDTNANPHGATMEFSADRASGYTGCNRWFASVTHNGEAIHFGQIGMTRMACQTGMQRDTERNFVTAIEAARYAHYDQDALVLLDAQQNQVARFDRDYSTE